MPFTRRVLIGGVLAGTTSIAIKGPDTPETAVAAKGTARVRRVPVKAKRKAAPAPSGRLQVAVIGTGVAGMALLQRLLDRSRTTRELSVAALCDVYEKNRQRAASMAELGSGDCYTDYRQLLSRGGLDAVFIATPDHWHARMAIDAMAAGIDVYLEPPLALTVADANQVHKATTTYRRVLQIGCPTISDPRYAVARDLIRNGHIGQVLWAQTTHSTNAVDGEWNEFVEPEATPSTVHWDLWRGPAADRPFSGERFFRWRKYWDYSGGIATQVFFPKLAALLTALGPDYPQRVSASGGIFVHRDREVPDTYSCHIEYAGHQVLMAASTASAAPNRFAGDVIYGNRGTISFGRDMVQLHAEPAWESAMPESDRGVHQYEVKAADLAEDHITNFLESVHARRQPVFDTAFGLQVLTPILLGVESYRAGRTIAFDPRAVKVLDQAPRRPTYEGTGRNHPDGKKRRA